MTTEKYYSINAFRIPTQPASETRRHEVVYFSQCRLTDFFSRSLKSRYRFSHLSQEFSIWGSLDVIIMIVGNRHCTWISKTMRRCFRFTYILYLCERHGSNSSPSSYDTIGMQTGVFDLRMATSLRERSSELKSVKLHFQIHLIPHPALHECFGCINMLQLSEKTREQYRPDTIKINHFLPQEHIIYEEGRSMNRLNSREKKNLVGVQLSK